MSDKTEKYARIIDNIIVVKKGCSPLPLKKNTVLPLRTEDKGSGFVVLLSGERGVVLQSCCVQILSKREALECKKQAALV